MQLVHWKDKMNTNGGHFQFQLKPTVGGGQAGCRWLREAVLLLLLDRNHSAPLSKT